METVEIKHHIQTKQFDSFYIFAGTEWRVQRIYIDQIAKVSGKPLKYVDSINDIYSNLQSTSFIPKSYVYVIRDDKELQQNEKLQSQLDSILKNNILILILTTVDKRLKFYKQYKDTICEFETLKPEVLKKYVQKEINLSDRNCDKLMEVCEYDYGRCLLEIDKIKHFMNADSSVDGMLEDGAFAYLLKVGAIYQPPKDAIFDFVDAILDRKVNRAFDLYHQCLEVGEATLVMLTVLYNNAKAVLQVQSCKNTKDLAKSTGLTSYQIFGANKHLNNYRNGELIYIMKLCQKCQQGIVTGTMDEEFVMESILTDIL